MLWGIKLLRFFNFYLMFYVSVLLSRRSMTPVQRRRTCGCRDQQSPSTTLTPSPKSRPSARAMEGQINLGMELGSVILTLPLVGHWLLVHYQVKYEDLNLCCTCIIACPVWSGFVLFFYFTLLYTINSDCLLSSLYALHDYILFIPIDTE